MLTRPSITMQLVFAWLCCFVSSCVAVAGPQARVVNSCPFAVYLQSVQLEARPMQYLGPGAVYSEDCRPVVEGTGVSIKIAKALQLDSWHIDNDGPVTQFEYGYTPWQLPSDLYYDVSDINDAAIRQFCSYGLEVQHSAPECPQIVCPPGCDTFCLQAYNQPNDIATKGCHSGGDITLTLCAYI